MRVGLPVDVRIAEQRQDRMIERRRGDLDNILKATLDALNGIAYRDDDQVQQITAVRYDDKRAPRIEVSVVALT